MSWSDEYTSERAFWVALRTRAARHAKTHPTVQSQELLRQFVIQRFMTRVFTAPDAAWVVAGGTGTLIRIPGSRATQDLDLTTIRSGTGTRNDLESFTGTNELDPFVYRITGQQTFTGTVAGNKFRIAASVGAESAAWFDVDLAVDEVAISAIEYRDVNPAVPGMRGLSPIPAVPLFPLASQVADKVVGVMFRDPRGRSANRYRDLVDLVLYAGAVDVAAGDLRRALVSRSQRRNQQPPNQIEVPDQWQNGYQRIAARTTLPTPLQDCDIAAEAVGAWLNPPLSGKVADDYLWDHRTSAWHDPTQPATRPGKVWVRAHMRNGAPVSDYFRNSPRTHR
ncbi:nucleotidyl transferase AbiEii/AbiGii toxin family protein (plasmid) [Mycobacterium kubicae]|uniref:nucleotidyl transferase AbiEii/AbiGii toxin family protein n=1 Tax=Mycobacterium kubicae TaxID=120959 RepID=UPI001641BA7B|nr:nucleotidyl transferase AbiEii/AbiGii toxin family protein [Mycobacterium kubicae]QNI09769.1 nucleotidyl transferase AbiEii/AbiGii toxin family protein [Mycobacterium kubicae]